MLQQFDFVRVSGYKGVAFTFLGHGRCWLDNGDGVPEWEPNENLARVCMVGDDNVLEVNIDDLTTLDQNEFCMDCGQIGCSHGRYPEAEE